MTPEKFFELGRVYLESLMNTHKHTFIDLLHDETDFTLSNIRVLDKIERLEWSIKLAIVANEIIQEPDLNAAFVINSFVYGLKNPCHLDVTETLLETCLLDLVNFLREQKGDSPLLTLPITTNRFQT